MARIPISIKKIKVEAPQYRLDNTPLNDKSEIVEYLFKIEEKGQNWEKTFICDRKTLIDFRNLLTERLESTTTSEVLSISKEDAIIIDEHYNSDDLCKSCNYKLTDYCKTCLLTLQSPLERKLFLELNKAYVKFETQYPINWKGERISIEGKSYNNPLNNFKDVLTVSDFYIQRKNVKLCIYTDGHSYHERTEEQAQHDRNIDRKLQELGFKVLRYTGKDVLTKMEDIISEIKNWIN